MLSRIDADQWRAKLIVHSTREFEDGCDRGPGADLDHDRPLNIGQPVFVTRLLFSDPIPNKGVVTKHDHIGSGNGSETGARRRLVTEQALWFVDIRLEGSVSGNPTAFYSRIARVVRIVLH